MWRSRLTRTSFARSSLRRIEGEPRQLIGQSRGPGQTDETWDMALTVLHCPPRQSRFLARLFARLARMIVAATSRRASNLNLIYNSLLIERRVPPCYNFVVEDVRRCEVRRARPRDAKCEFEGALSGRSGPDHVHQFRPTPLVALAVVIPHPLVTIPQSGRRVATSRAGWRLADPADPPGDLLDLLRLCLPWFGRFCPRARPAQPGQQPLLADRPDHTPRIEAR